VTLGFEGRPETLALTDSGMNIWLTGELTTDTFNPIVRPLNGSIRTPSQLPDLGISPNGQPYGVSVALSDDLINQILYVVYRTGMIHMDVPAGIDACDPVFYALLPNICDTYGSGTPRAALLNISIRPQLPPVFIVSPDKAGTIATEIQIGDMFIHLLVDDGGAGTPVLTLSVSAKIPTEISHLWEDNSLNVAFGEMDVVVDTVSNPTGLPENLFEGIAPMLVEFILPLLEDAIEGFQMPEFDVSGDIYRPRLNNLFVLGSGNDFIGVFGDIEAVTP